MRKIASVLIVLVYDPLIAALLPLAVVVSLFQPKVKKYLFSRGNVLTLRRKLKRIPGKDMTWFVCSSIGDLEQTLPLISELQKNNKPFFLFFHSPNGCKHAASLGYNNISFCPIDMFVIWAFLFAGSKPAVCIINRHDFWPGFIAAATLWSKLYVINAVQKDRHGTLEGPFEQWVYGNSRKVFFVNNIRSFSANELQAGDTRVDRLLQRYLAEEKDRGLICRQYKNEAKSTLVIGNGYPADIQILRAALGEYPELQRMWSFIIIPSRPAMADEMECILGDTLKNGDVKLVPVMGKLFQYYACADLAWVGGGFSPTGIHNTLEPAFYGISLISGPNLNNQPDAIMFHQKNVLTTFSTAAELNSLMASAPTDHIHPTDTKQISPTALILKEIYQS